jgi:comEA protein
MKNFMFKGLVLSLILGLVFSSALSLQVQQAQQTSEKKVNINTASALELQKLPRIGPKVAQRIIDFRNQNGKFKSIEEIMKVRGIGEKLFKQIKDMITVGEEVKKQPVALNIGGEIPLIF